MQSTTFGHPPDASTVQKESGQLELECEKIMPCILLLNILCLICIGLSAEGEGDHLAIDWHLSSQAKKGFESKEEHFL